MEVVEMKTAKLFANGRSQAVRLPKEFRFSGDEVYIKKVGYTVMLFPKDRLWETHLDLVNWAES
jgi:antitoxin VapB